MNIKDATGVKTTAAVSPTAFCHPSKKHNYLERMEILLKYFFPAPRPPPPTPHPITVTMIETRRDGFLLVHNGNGCHCNDHHLAASVLPNQQTPQSQNPNWMTVFFFSFTHLWCPPLFLTAFLSMVVNLFRPQTALMSD